MILEKFNATRSATGMFQSCILSGSYGLRECAESVSDVIDIGANVGFFAVAARVLCPNAQVIAVEPEPKTYQQLLANAKHLRIQPVNAGLGPIALRLKYKSGPDLGPFGVRFDPEGSGPDLIPGVTLQQIVRAFNVEPHGLFLKVDCEGGERHLIGDKESEEIIAGCVGIGGEYHFVDSGPTLKDFESWLLSLVGDTHAVTFFDQFRHGKLCEFRAIRKHREPAPYRDASSLLRSVTFVRKVKQAPRKTRRRVYAKGETVELPYEFASHMVCCGYCKYSYFE